MEAWQNLLGDPPFWPITGAYLGLMLIACSPVLAFTSPIWGSTLGISFGFAGAGLTVASIPVICLVSPVLLPIGAVPCLGIGVCGLGTIGICGTGVCGGAAGIIALISAMMGIPITEIVGVIPVCGPMLTAILSTLGCIPTGAL